MAEQKMLAPNTTIWWIDKTDLADYTAPKASELNGSGVNISCAIVEGYTLGSTDPQVDTTRTICDEGNVQNPTHSQYEGNLTAFRDANLGDSGSIFNTFFGLFSQVGADGYLVRRVGKKSSTQAAVSDDVEVFGFTNDHPQSVDGAENGPPIQMTVPFLPTGEYSGIVALA